MLDQNVSQNFIHVQYLQVVMLKLVLRRYYSCTFVGHITLIKGLFNTWHITLCCDTTHHTRRLVTAKGEITKRESLAELLTYLTGRQQQ